MIPIEFINIESNLKSTSFTIFFAFYWCLSQNKANIILMLCALDTLGTRFCITYGNRGPWGERHFGCAWEYRLLAGQKVTVAG